MFVDIESKEVLQNLISSGIFLCFILVIRIIIFRVVNSWKLPDTKARRRWLFQVKNLLLFILVLGLVVIWAKELRTVAISLVAVAAAMVLATKEIIQCFLGGIYKLSTRPFEIGDRIEINGFRGDVTDHNILVTTLFEIGPQAKGHQYTGKMLSIPNSLFLTHPLVNETATQAYTLHVFSIPFKTSNRWAEARDILLDICMEECTSYLEQAKKHLRKVSEKEGFENPDASPRVNVHISSSTELEFFVRIPVPAAKRGRIEQSIKQSFLSRWDFSQDTKEI